jgi:DNA-binding YbaB/EbfC family protein
MFDMAKMMKQAQQLQGKMEAAQAELEGVFVTGEAGSAAVKITVNAKMAVQSVSISPEALGDAGMLEDLIKLALEDAYAKANAATQDKMKSVTGGLNIPGLKLPF